MRGQYGFIEDDRLDTSSVQIQLETDPASLLPPKEPKHSVSDTSTPNSTVQPNQRPEEVHRFPIESENTHSSGDQIQPQASTAGVDTITLIVTVIADSFSMSRLPAPEPTIFSGEPIHYSDWKSSFHALIHRKNLPSSDKMYYLKRYVSGSAKEAINGLFLQNSSEAYERAWNN